MGRDLESASAQTQAVAFLAKEKIGKQEGQRGSRRPKRRKTPGGRPWWAAGSDLSPGMEVRRKFCKRAIRSKFRSLGAWEVSMHVFFPLKKMFLAAAERQGPETGRLQKEREKAGGPAPGLYSLCVGRRVSLFFKISYIIKKLRHFPRSQYGFIKLMRKENTQEK